VNQVGYEIYKKQKFDKEKWIAAEKIYNPEPGVYLKDLNCVRGKMYDDLKRNYLKKDKDIKDIEQLLGKTTVRRIYKRRNCPL
jgi:hypothetical protein